MADNFFQHTSEMLSMRAIFLIFVAGNPGIESAIICWSFSLVEMSSLVIWQLDKKHLEVKTFRHRKKVPALIILQIKNIWALWFNVKF